MLSFTYYTCIEVFKMFKIDKLKRIFDCDSCSSTLVDPITLPCGDTVCKRHLDKFSDKFKCDLCHGIHVIPQNGFVVNKRLKAGLDIEINSLKLTPAYEECKARLEKVAEKAVEIENLIRNPKDISDYFNELRKKVDSRKEEIRSKIEVYCLELSDIIDRTELDCHIRIEQGNQATIKTIGDLKAELDQLIAKIDEFEIDESKLKNLKNRADTLQGQYEKIGAEYYGSLFANNAYEFVFNSNLHVSQLFGTIQAIKDFKKVIIFSE